MEGGCLHSFAWTSTGTGSPTPTEHYTTCCGSCGTWASWRDGKWNVADESLGSRAMAALIKRDDALTEILAVLGTGNCPVSKCEGCQWEAQEAIEIAKEALGLVARSEARELGRQVVVKHGEALRRLADSPTENTTTERTEDGS